MLFLIIKTVVCFMYLLRIEVHYW